MVDTISTPYQPSEQGDRTHTLKSPSLTLIMDLLGNVRPDFWALLLSGGGVLRAKILPLSLYFTVGHAIPIKHSFCLKRIQYTLGFEGVLIVELRSRQLNASAGDYS